MQHQASTHLALQQTRVPANRDTEGLSARTKVHRKQACCLPLLLASWCLLLCWAWLACSPARVRGLQRLQVDLTAWTSLSRSRLFFLHVCQHWGGKARSRAWHTKPVPLWLGIYLNTPGCGWSKHHVQGTEVRTWANRSEVASETTEQIFACNALWQITERQPAKGGEVRSRQGTACLLSHAEDINVKTESSRPLGQL